MRFVRVLLIFSYGLFTIAAQALLFREFITTFEGNDISVGIFFACWFLWVGLGAVVVNKAHAFAEKLLKNIEFLFLCYLPAFILQFVLIIQARELVGIESYTLWSVWAILVASIIVNAPVSFITGMLFPVACRWAEKDRKLPVSQVYIIEAAGSFAGGIGVTVLLALGVSSSIVFFMLALFISVSVALTQLARAAQCNEPALKKSGRIRAQLMFLVPLFLVLCLFIRADKALMRQIRVVKWTKLLPADSLAGSFQTPQAEYLYGVYQNQWVVMSGGSVIETLPDESSAGRIAAIGLCQKPDSKKVLVVGSGLGLCRQFLKLPQIEDVSWAHCDGEYMQQMNKVIPQEFKITDSRLHFLTDDIRSSLPERTQLFDIVILNLPDVTSSVFNRYYTLEFYHQIKSALKPDGIVQVHIRGGENIMGTELTNLGASTKLTLEEVFSQLVIVPGEDSWFVVSDSEDLTGDPGTLRDRFGGIENAGLIFTPQALLSVYLPDRAAMAAENYSNADLPEKLLINRDSRPLTHLYSLLLAARQSGAPVTKLIKYIVLTGPLFFIVPVVVYILLRVIYVLRTTQQGSKSGFDSSFLVFSAGSVAIGVVIVLMYLYQTNFGSLYLYIGVVSSLFMVGLAVSAALTRFVLTSNRKIQPHILLLVVILVHSLVLYTIAFWPAEQLTHLTFAVMFVACGLCAGCYFPVAARQMDDFAIEAGQAGSKLEAADHIGAAAGGLLTSLILVPVLGIRFTLFMFILVIFANVPPVFLRIYKPEKVCSFDRVTLRLRKFGYILFGIGVTLVLCSDLLAMAGSRLSSSLPQHSAQALAGSLRIERQSAILQDNIRKIDYFEVWDANNALTGYIFSSKDLAPDIRGFGGGINLAIYVNESEGKLISFHIVNSNETPSYLELVSKWCDSLNGYLLFRPRSLADVHTVTGATVSSKAILSALQTSGHRFATQILGRTIQAEPQEETRQAGYLPDNQAVYLAGAVILALMVIFRGGFWSRLVVLCFNLVIGGIVLNAQYSTEQIATILSFHVPAIRMTGAFLLVVGVPLLVMVFGNIYCGYVCPFGAAQELLGFIIPRKFKYPLPVEKIQKARFIKYVTLFVLVAIFFISRNRTTLIGDPLIRVFSFQFSASDIKLWVLIVLAISLVGSVFYTRFWCLYLCPAGAFLSLFSKFAILNKYLPVKRYGKCEFGLSPADKMDCIYCDRCRYQAKKVPKEELLPVASYLPVKILSGYFFAIVLITAVFVSSLSVNRFFKVASAGGFDRSVISISSGGQPRDIDLQRVRTMIQQKQLSDREAEFYEKVE